MSTPRWKKYLGRTLRAPSDQPWGEKRIIATLITGSVMVVALLGFGLYTIGSMLLTPGDAPTAQDKVSAQLRRDALANQPMSSAPPEAASPQVLTDKTIPIMVIPTPRAQGPAGVKSGFPRTPEGAVSQLAAISTAALTYTEADRAQRVIEAWAMPGGPTAQTWSAIGALNALKNSSKAGLADDPTIDLSFTPLMGMIKGTDGENFVLACINGELKATYRNVARRAAADCQRMQWHQGRWMIAPGDEPAHPPAAWSGSTQSIEYGWKALRAEHLVKAPNE